MPAMNGLRNCPRQHARAIRRPAMTASPNGISVNPSGTNVSVPPPEDRSIPWMAAMVNGVQWATSHTWPANCRPPSAPRESKPPASHTAAISSPVSNRPTAATASSSMTPCSHKGMGNPSSEPLRSESAES